MKPTNPLFWATYSTVNAINPYIVCGSDNGQCTQLGGTY